MKKRVCALFASLCILLGGCGLSSSDTGEAAETMTVYRLSASDASMSGGLTKSQEVSLPPGTQADVETALDLFASDTGDQALRPALPDGVQVEGWTLDNGVVTLTLSDSFLSLSQMDKTVTAFCAALTLCQLDEVDAVTVVSGGEVLFQGIVPEDALLKDTDTDPYTKQLRLYFANEDGRYLVSEYHSLTVAEDTSLERYVMEELLRGPNSADLRSAIPSGTELLSCSTTDGVCTVNLSEDFLLNKPDSALGERLTIYSIVDSLTALSTVDSVIIQVEGKSVGPYVWRDLSGALSRCEAAIGPVFAAKGEMDANLYMALPGLENLAAMPYIVETGDGATQPEAVLTALLQADEPGYPALFSGADSLISVRMEGNQCIVDVTESFFASMDTEAKRLAAVRSVAATLCGLDGIQSVVFTVSDDNAVFDGVDYSGPWTTDSSIIVK
jgi:germination protein M